jgi:hypothetical protein
MKSAMHAVMMDMGKAAMEGRKQRFAPKAVAVVEVEPKSDMDEPVDPISEENEISPEELDELSRSAQ